MRPPHTRVSYLHYSLIRFISINSIFTESTKNINQSQASQTCITLRPTASFPHHNHISPLLINANSPQHISNCPNSKQRSPLRLNSLIHAFTIVTSRLIHDPAISCFTKVSYSRQTHAKQFLALSYLCNQKLFIIASSSQPLCELCSSMRHSSQSPLLTPMLHVNAKCKSDALYSMISGFDPNQAHP